MCRAYIPKSNVKWFTQLMLDETQFDLWLSTRLISQKTLNNTKFDYYAEFRIKNSTVLSQYSDEFDMRGIMIKILVEDLYE